MLTKSGWVETRWFCNQDLPILVKLHAACYPYENWTEADFVKFTTKTSQICKVAVDEDNRVVGCLLYRLAKKEARLARVAVWPELRRQKIGTALVGSLIGKNSPIRRRVFAAHVRDNNLAAQLFLKQCGFRCIQVMRNLYETQDGYLFRYEKNEAHRDSLLNKGLTVT